MRMIDDMFSIELNFLDEMNLSRKGMIEEIKSEFDIVRLCLMEWKELDERYQGIIEKIVVMPIRKLLCDNNSVLKIVCPEFKMPPLVGFEGEIGNKQHIVRTPYIVSDMDKWIKVDDWLKERVSWFERNAEDHTKMLPAFTYEAILNRLGKKEFRKYIESFQNMFVKETISYMGSNEEVFVRVNPESLDDTNNIFKILKEIGYNDLSIYEFVKKISDQKGAHIDKRNSVMMQLVNYPDKFNLTPIFYFAIQMVYAAKKQIPELSNYWPEMPNLQT